MVGRPVSSRACHSRAMSRGRELPPAVRLRRAANLANGSTLLGLLVAAAGRARIRPGPLGLLVGSGYRLPVPAARAFTLGDVVLHRYSPGWLEARPRLLAHEARHAVQWACCLGVPMLPLYLAASGWSWLRAGDWATRNVFEVRAGLADGGYGPARDHRRITPPQPSRRTRAPAS